MPVKEWTVLFPTSLDRIKSTTIVNDDLGVPSQLIV